MTLRVAIIRIMTIVEQTFLEALCM
jgi:hypothetical protein